MEPHVAQQFAQHVHKSRSVTNAEICHSSMAQASAKQLCAASCGSFPHHVFFSLFPIYGIMIVSSAYYHILDIVIYIYILIYIYIYICIYCVYIY